MRNIMYNAFHIILLVSIVLLYVGPILFVKAYNNPNKKKQENIGFTMTTIAMVTLVINGIICYGTTDGRAASSYTYEYHELRWELENTSTEFGGITTDQCQRAIAHNKKKATLHDTWITNTIYGIDVNDEEYLIDLSEYSVLSVET